MSAPTSGTWLSRDSIDASEFTEKGVITDRYVRWIESVFPNQQVLWDTNQKRNEYIARTLRNNLTNLYSQTDQKMTKIREDLNRTFGRLRLQYGLKASPDEDEIPLFEAMMRMVVYLDTMKPQKENLFRYRQTMIDLIIPVYHTVWCYFNRCKSITDSIHIESLTVELFQRIMIESGHIHKLPGSPNPLVPYDKVDDAIPEDLQQKLEKHDITMAQFIAMRWFLLLFVQDFKFNEVLILWDSMLGNVRKLEKRCHVLSRLGFRALADKIRGMTDPAEILDVLNNITMHIGVSVEGHDVKFTVK